jgi:uncharacterized protein (TIGR02569 family)
MEVTPSSEALQEFDASTTFSKLPGGENRTFRAGSLVLKHLNNDSFESAIWSAELFDQIQEHGFRVSRPVKTKTGEWITPDGWSAWKFLDGNHDFEDYIDKTINGIQAFHQALKNSPKPTFLDKSNSFYSRADMYSWEDKPKIIHPDLIEDVDKLYVLRKPISVTNQLIHGDINPDNVLLTSDQPPAIIDIAPYWRPAEFALAIYAYWIAAYGNRPELLEHFREIDHFNQLLIRAGIRMLLIMSESGNINELEKYRRATEIIEEFANA